MQSFDDPLSSIGVMNASLLIWVQSPCSELLRIVRTEVSPDPARTIRGWRGGLCIMYGRQIVLA